MPGGGPTSPSLLVIEELFARGDDALLERLLEFTPGRTITGLAQRWATDPRPWAIEILDRYLYWARNQPPHRVLIKRLYKAAERAGRDEVVGLCLSHFDRWLRRKVAHHYRSERVGPNRWEIITTDYLRTPPGGGAKSAFSVKTRHYLRRRCWRYFRRMGFRDGPRYVAAVAGLLRWYRDPDVQAGPALIDCWGLVHACFGKSEVLRFNARHTLIRAEKGLSQLAAAPMFERHWSAEASAGVLMSLLARAESRVVRVWAIQLLRRHHMARLDAVDADVIVSLVDHADAEVQAFGADLLAAARGSDKWPVATWLRLLEVRNLTALETIVAAFRRVVAPTRLTLEQSVTLANAPAVPVARLGQWLLRSRAIRTDAERAIVARLADAASEAVAGELAAWALPVVGAAGAYDVDRVVAFFDARPATTRASALAWLTPQSAGWADPTLFARLLETPFDDVRFALLAILNERAKLPGAGPDALTPLWAGVLLNIHRGGRAKLTALRQISAAVIAAPDAARTLLPLVAVAIRSVRPPEARTGLAAVVTAVDREPSLRPLVERLLPELKLPATFTASTAPRGDAA